MTLHLDAPEALDLVVRGGRVFDPGSGLDARLDVGIRHGRIVALAPDLSERTAAPRRTMPMDPGTAVIEAGGRLVTPGFIDLHTHVYVGVSQLTVPVDVASPVGGVTTSVSAGDAGAHTIEGFRRLAVEGSRTRVLAFLHVSTIGLSAWPVGEARIPELLDVAAGVRAARAHADVVVGIKVRMGGPSIIGDGGLEPLRRAVAIADQVDQPVMMHIGDGPRPLGELLALLRPGDIVTHAFTSSANTLLEGGRLARGVEAARERGIRFDVGHGSSSFSFAVAEAAAAARFWPDTISTDLHALSINGPALDLPTTMSKMLHLGMELPDVVRAVTSVPATLVGRSDRLGAIGLGRTADLAVISLRDEDHLVHDADAASRSLRRRIVVHHTIRAGVPWGPPYPLPAQGVGIMAD